MTATLAPADPARIELAVVGAHLTGMPLNGELQRLDARFLRAIRTEPCYRLFALTGAITKPGLLRTGPGEGHAIEAEVWSLAPMEFALFVAAIPAPLGIGTLRLADGSRPKGFLVEAVAVEKAEDVSHHGGWRAYQASLRSVA